jgi:hypothetical protein
MSSSSHLTLLPAAVPDDIRGPATYLAFRLRCLARRVCKIIKRNSNKVNSKIGKDGEGERATGTRQGKSRQEQESGFTEHGGEREEPKASCSSKTHLYATVW